MFLIFAVHFPSCSSIASRYSCSDEARSSFSNKPLTEGMSEARVNVTASPSQTHNERTQTETYADAVEWSERDQFMFSGIVFISQSRLAHHGTD